MMDERLEQSLVSSARTLRNLLRDVDSVSAPLWSGPQLDTAIQRYVQIFLPMLASHAGVSRVSLLTAVANKKLLSSYMQVKTGAMYKNILPKEDRDAYMKPFDALGNAKNVLAVLPTPPVDVAFIWALHRLSPLDYVKDCKKLFGAPLPTYNGLDYISAHNAGEERAVVARLQWSCFARAVRDLEPFRLFQYKTCRSERKTFLPVYLWPRYKTSTSSLVTSFQFNESKRVFEKEWESPLRYDLKAAAARQKQFLFNISHEYFDGDASLSRGAERYGQFLELMRDNPGTFLVPMYDIDLVWHAHILRDTKRYAEDTKKIVGRFVNHKEDDDRNEGGELDNGFKQTVELWQEKYGEAYEDHDTNYRGRISDSENRVLRGKHAILVKDNEDWRNQFVKDSVCEKCKDATASKMHDECRVNFMNAVRQERSGQVRGGACAALYSKGYIGAVAIYSQSGGACGGIFGDPKGGCGCGGGGGGCGAGGCGGGGCGGGGCGYGGGACGGGGGGGCGGGGGGCTGGGAGCGGGGCGGGCGGC